MWAQRLIGPGRFEMTEVATPVPADLPPGHTLLRVLGGAICGSDLPYFTGRVCPLFDDTRPGAAGRAGFPLHEVLGEVVASADPALAVGGRAVGWASGTDALAEYVVTPNDDLLAPAADLSDAAALTLQPLACVLDAVGRLQPSRVDRVAVLGLGPFGLLLAHVLHDAGVAEVIGVDRIDRRDVGGLFGVDHVIHSSTDRWARGLAGSDRPTLVVEAIGHQTVTLGDAIEAVAAGGTILGFGVPDDDVYPVRFGELFRKGVTLTGGVVEDRRRSLQAAADFLARDPGLSQALVTHTFEFASAQEAFELASRPAPGQLKIQLTAG